VPPPVAVNVIDVKEQFNMLEFEVFVIPAVGAAVVWVMVVLAVAVQPLAPVAVTV
jgi:hypothetical protein